MTKFLFNEFNEVSSKEWKQKIQVDLKGANYNDTLVWNSLEGIDVKPFYHQDEAGQQISKELNNPKDWKICQEFFIDNESITNQLIVDACFRGAESIVLTASNEFDFESVFLNFPFESTPIYFDFKFLSETFLKKLHTYFSNKKAVVFYNLDILGNIAKTGNWFIKQKKDHQVLENILSFNNYQQVLSIDSTLYQNAGANMVQQLAYAMAHANEYLNHYNNEITSDNIDFSEPLITFKVAVGSNYFFEIAKIRALRKLFALLAKEYHIASDCHIIAFPSRRNKTLYDYNVNMLRTTTEYMSAIIGGADGVCSLAYDAIYHKSNEFGARIARNQLLVLKEESYFKSLESPANGSYYIESVTNQLSEKALSLFKNIETNGGYLHQLKEGIIQRKIKESSKKEQELFDLEIIKLVGTNLHQNPNDKMKDELDLFPFTKKQVRKTILEPIIEKRISEKIELKRINQES